MPTEVIQNEVLQEENVPEEEEVGSDLSLEDVRRESSLPFIRQISVQRELADAIVRLAPLEELKILIKCGANINESITQGLTPLHYAVWQRYQEAAEFLIEEGCDVNAQDDIGYTALHLSAEHGYVNMMEILLKHNAQVTFNNSIPAYDYPLEAVDEPLRLALKNDHMKAAKLLLEHGANPNSCYFFGHEINLINPFNTDMVGLLLLYGADPNARDRQSLSPLMKACRLHQGSAEDLAHQETISGKDVLVHFNQTLMGLETVLLLVNHGADINLRTDTRHDFRTVLHYAVLSGSVAIVNLLIKQGANVNFEKDYCRPTPLDLAILKGDVSMIELLIEADVDVNACSPIIGSPLHMVCGEGIKSRMEILKLLLEKGANPNQIVYSTDDRPIRTVLGEYLSSNDHYDIEIVKLLLKYGAEVVMQNQNHDPRGILTDIPNLSEKHLRVLNTILEAAFKFDLPLIKQSSLIDEKQRQILLHAGKTPSSMKHLSRVFLRQHLKSKLPNRVDELEIPTTLKQYLLYEIR